jgi:hypothetical protein
MMVSDQPRRAHAFLVMLRIICTGAMLCLCVLVWFAGQSPAVHASGVPWCPNPLPDEHAPTRPAIHLNRHEGPVGTDLTVTAHGWRPGAHVALRFDARDPKSGEMYTLIPDLAKGMVGRDGTITLSSLDAPSFFCVDMYSRDNTDYRFDASGGTKAFFVLVSDHGEVSAPVAFKYLPAPTVVIHDIHWPEGATVGLSVTVSGSGWETHEPLSLTLMTGDPTALKEQPYATRTQVTTDAQGNFLTGYPLDARLRWNINVWLVVVGSGPRFGALIEYGDLFLSPAIQPTFQVDRTMVTPGMTLTVSGEHWYPGDTFTIKYCNAHWQDGSWVNGPNCGKEANPALGTVTVAADGRIHQRFIIPENGPPRTILVRINEIAGGINVHPIPVQVVNHLPTWDDIHPRVAALRNKVVGSLPFTIPAALLLGALAFFAIRRWRVRQAPRA